MQLDLFPTSISLRCIDPALNKRRFYSMDVQPHFFGEWELVCQWGWIGTHGSRPPRRVRLERSRERRLTKSVKSNVQ